VLLAAKKAKGLTFTQVGEAIGRNDAWVALIAYRQVTALLEEANTLIGLLRSRGRACGRLAGVPHQGLAGSGDSYQPLIYRFYEIMQVCGLLMKDVIQKKFSDGNMSVINFTLEVDKEANPAGDRMKITMCGKFLPYKKW